MRTDYVYTTVFQKTMRACYGKQWTYWSDLKQQKSCSLQYKIPCIHRQSIHRVAPANSVSCMYRNVSAKTRKNVDASDLLELYRIALTFRGSKFSRIPAFSEFRWNNFANALLNVAQLLSVKFFSEVLSRTIPNSRIRESKDPRNITPIWHLSNFLCCVKFVGRCVNSCLVQECVDNACCTLWRHSSTPQ